MDENPFQAAKAEASRYRSIQIRGAPVIWDVRRDLYSVVPVCHEVVFNAEGVLEGYLSRKGEIWPPRWAGRDEMKQVKKRSEMKSESKEDMPVRPGPLHRYLSSLVTLQSLINSGLGNGEAADHVRERMDAPWASMSTEERNLVGDISALMGAGEKESETEAGFTPIFADGVRVGPGDMIRLADPSCGCMFEVVPEKRQAKENET